MLIAKVSQPIPGGKRELVEVESEKGVEGGGRPKVIKKERGRRKKEQGDFFYFSPFIATCPNVPYLSDCRGSAVKYQPRGRRGTG